MFGAAGVLIVKVAQPVVAGLTQAIPPAVLHAVCAVCAALLVALAWVGLLLRVYHEATAQTRGSASTAARRAASGSAAAGETAEASA